MLLFVFIVILFLRVQVQIKAHDAKINLIKEDLSKVLSLNSDLTEAISLVTAIDNRTDSTATTLLEIHGKISLLLDKLKK